MERDCLIGYGASMLLQEARSPAYVHLYALSDVRQHRG